MPMKMLLSSLAIYSILINTFASNPVQANQSNQRKLQEPEVKRYNQPSKCIDAAKKVTYKNATHSGKSSGRKSKNGHYTHIEGYYLESGKIIQVTQRMNSNPSSYLNNDLIKHAKCIIRSYDLKILFDKMEIQL